MLMAKSRHKKPENVRKYFYLFPEAMAEVTSLLESVCFRELAADVADAGVQPRVTEAVGEAAGAVVIP